MSDNSLRDLRQPSGATRPKVEFPCDYPLKIVGNAAEDFRDAVVAIVERHAPGFDRTSVQVIDSRNGRFQSVRLTITAESEPQLQRLFNDLKATGRVHMVV